MVLGISDIPTILVIAGLIFLFIAIEAVQQLPRNR